MATFDSGEFYTHCGCRKYDFIRWDPHPDCVRHVPLGHYQEVMRDIEAEPRCCYCAKLRVSERVRWMQLHDSVMSRDEASTSVYANRDSNTQFAATATVGRRDDFDVALPPSGTVAKRSSLAAETEFDPPNPCIGYASTHPQLNDDWEDDDRGSCGMEGDALDSPHSPQQLETRDGEARAPNSVP